VAAAADAPIPPKSTFDHKWYIPDVPAQTTAQYGVPTINNCSLVEAAVSTQALAQDAQGTEAMFVT
jgi:hypothetical protein